MRGVTECDNVVDDQRTAVPQAHEAGEIDESRAERLGSPSTDPVRPVYDGMPVTDAGAHRRVRVGEAVTWLEVEGCATSDITMTGERAV
jgi:hypothetical protein